MPELPEVETVVRELRPLLVQRSIVSIHCSKNSLRRPWESDWNAQLINQTITSLRRRGKWILIDCDNQATLLLHLGMTGQLTVTKCLDKYDNHTHLRFVLDDKIHELRFRDIRRFGSADWFPTHQQLQTFLDERLGPEPFNIDTDNFHQAISNTTRPLKAILLDQTILAGIGNIYADEAAFQSQIHPTRRGCDIQKSESERLCQCIETVLTRAIAGRGSTIRNYVGGSGLKGSYQNEFHVYGRKGQPCHICSNSIEVVTVGGRSSHYCPNCQRRPRRRTNSRARGS
jgi:formamidopyrimidine-DNA glycosylase